uniref:hypothetical protein n=1 Tax=Candidatus Electrothrix sp. TaxID=2170559 RepID=UPI004057211F
MNTKSLGAGRLFLVFFVAGNRTKFPQLFFFTKKKFFSELKEVSAEFFLPVNKINVKKLFLVFHGKRVLKKMLIDKYPEMRLIIIFVCSDSLLQYFLIARISLYASQQR